MKIKKEFIILPAIILVLVLVLVIANPQKNIQYKLPRIGAIAEDSIDRIEYNSLVLVKNSTSGVWHLDPRNYPLDPMKVQEMINIVKEMKLSELISQQQTYSRYQLTEDSRIPVTIYAGGKVALKFDVGKFSSSGNHTFIKMEDNPDVYSIKGDVNSVFSKTIKDLRDTQIFAFDKNSIKEIIFDYKGEHITVQKAMVPVSENDASAGEKEIWKLEGEETLVKNKVIDDLLNEYAHLKCDSFIPEDSLKDFSDPEGKVTFKGDKEYSITLLERQSDNMHPAISSGSEYQFYLIGWRANRALKGLADLVEEEK